MDGARCCYNPPSWGTFEPLRAKTCSLWNSRNILGTFMAWIGITSSWIALAKWQVYLHSKNIDNYLRRWILMCGYKYLSYFDVETLRNLYLNQQYMFQNTAYCWLLAAYELRGRILIILRSFYLADDYIYILCEWKSIIRFYYANGMIGPILFFDRMRIKYPGAKWPWSTMVLK
jgi:hypothetical protein